MKKTLTYILLLSCVSCTSEFYDSEMDKALNEKNTHSEIQVFDGEKEPVKIDLWKNNSTLLGIDSNNNGVRDDIEIWANWAIKKGLLRRGIKHLAKLERQQQIAMIDKNFKKLGFLDNQASNVYLCFRYLKIDKEENKILYEYYPKIWANTNERRDFDKRMSFPIAINTPSLDITPKIENCEFDILSTK